MLTNWKINWLGLVTKSGMAVLVLLVLAACATNPVTGKNELSFISESQELAIGAQQYAPVRQSQGGDYRVDPQVQAYVDAVGQRLAAVSDRKLPYQFTVLNNSVPNAWALPGGKIAINRGLLVELTSEAELAAVLGHEIVHAAAKHGAQGMQRGMLLQGAIMATAIASQNSEYSNLAQLGASVGAQLVNQKYGRDAERESDQYGMLYMSRAGYDPLGAVKLQETFVKLSEGRNQDWLSGLFVSHPASQERLANNKEYAATLPAGGELGESRYQQNIHHLIKTKPAYQAYDDARKALQEGDTVQANTLLQKAISIEPKEGHFYSLQGDMLQRDKNYQAALRSYDQAIRLNEHFFYYFLKRGLVYDQLNDRAAAKSDLQRSIELLPSTDAYYVLGNIARAENQSNLAKEYYAKAAQNASEVGRAAFGELVELDLADNPAKYLRLRHGVNASARVMLEIGNPTPRDITGIVVALQYPASNGSTRQVNKALRGSLKAGQSTAVTLDIAIDPKRVSQLRSVIVAARVVN